MHTDEHTDMNTPLHAGGEHTYILADIHTRTCAGGHVRVRVRLHVKEHVHVDLCVCLSVRACMCVFVCVCVCVCVYIRAHAGLCL